MTQRPETTDLELLLKSEFLSHVDLVRNRIKRKLREIAREPDFSNPSARVRRRLKPEDEYLFGSPEFILGKFKPLDVQMRFMSETKNKQT